MREPDEDTESFDDGDIDALDLINVDAYQAKLNAEATAKVAGAIEDLSAVLAQVRDEKCTLDRPSRFVEQLRRLSQIAADYYAARGDE